MATIALAEPLLPPKPRPRSRPIHVLWVNEHARFTGGAEAYVHRTARLLAGRGVRNSLLYGVEGWTDPGFLAPFTGSWPLVDVSRQVREIAPDVVYVHRVAGAPAIEAIARPGIPTLRFFHDHRPFCLREHKYTTLGSSTCTRTLGPGCYACLGFVNRSDHWPGVELRGTFALEAELDACRRLAGVVVGSRYMAGHVAGHGFSPGRVHVLPLYAPEPADTAPVERERGQLLFVGQLVTGKGLDILLDALALLPADLRLSIVGTGRQERERRAQCERLGLSGRVRFLGSRSPEELEALYSAAWAVVAPSRSPETFGLVGPEAMRFATPVVATRVGGTGEWLEEGVTGLAVPPNDVVALAEALRRLHDDPALARLLGLAARERYLARFRPAQHIDLLLPLLEGVVR